MKNKIKIFNKIKVFIFLGILISSFLLLIINFFPVFSYNDGLRHELIDHFPADYTTYVNKSNPNKNFGQCWYCYIGDSCQTYVHFNLDKLPNHPEKVSFFLNWCEENCEVTISIVESDWEDYGTTWNLRPQMIEEIATVNTSRIAQSRMVEFYNFEKAIELTDFLKNYSNNELSLCISTTQSYNKSLGNIFLQGFRILWYDNRVILSYTNIFSTLLIVSMLIGIVFILKKEIYSCPYCKAQKVHNKIICPDCGKKFEEKNIVKRLDYSLIKIIASLSLFGLGGYVSLIFATLHFRTKNIFSYYVLKDEVEFIILFCFFISMSIFLCFERMFLKEYIRLKKKSKRLR